MQERERQLRRIGSNLERQIKAITAEMPEACASGNGRVYRDQNKSVSISRLEGVGEKRKIHFASIVPDCPGYTGIAPIILTIVIDQDGIEQISTNLGRGNNLEVNFRRYPLEDVRKRLSSASDYYRQREITDSERIRFVFRLFGLNPNTLHI